MSRLTPDGTAEPVSRDQMIRHARGQGNIHFPCSADHEQDWQPYPVDPYSAICDDHTYIHTYRALGNQKNVGVYCTISVIAVHGYRINKEYTGSLGYNFVYRKIRTHLDLLSLLHYI